MRNDIAIRLDSEMRQRIERVAAKQGRSLSNMVRYMMLVYLADHDPEGTVTTTPDAMARAGRSAAAAKRAKRAQAEQAQK